MSAGNAVVSAEMRNTYPKRLKSDRGKANARRSEAGGGDVPSGGWWNKNDGESVLDKLRL